MLSERGRINYVKIPLRSVLFAFISLQGFMAGVVQLMDVFFRFLPNVVYVDCSSETSKQTDYIIRYKNPKGCHNQNK